MYHSAKDFSSCQLVDASRTNVSLNSLSRLPEMFFYDPLDTCPVRDLLSPIHHLALL